MTRYFICLLLAASALVSIPARAQSSTEGSKGGREEFDKANAYFNAHEFEAALPYFRKAYELSGHRPSTVRALAQCERALKDYDNAIPHFQEYLASRPEEAKQIVGTLQMLEELRANEREKKRAEQLATKAAAKPTLAQDVQVAPQPAPRVELKTAAPTQPEVVSTETALQQPEESNTATVVLLVVGGLAVIGGAVALGLVLSGDAEPYGGNRDVVLR